MHAMTLPLLVPLEWPVQHASPIAYLVLLVLLPLAVGGIITVIGLAPSWRRSIDAPEQTTTPEHATEVARTER
jgi:hypothetical protein